MEQEHLLTALSRFVRGASGVAAPSDIMALLASVLEEQVHARVVVVIQGGPSRATLAVARNLPASSDDLASSHEMPAEEIERAVVAACSGTFAHSERRTLALSSAPFALVVMFFDDASKPTAEDLVLVDALVDVASTVLTSACHIERLKQSNAELRVSQDVLTQTEKLRALGQMAAGISHDLKNILNPLSLHLQFAERALLRGKVDDARESIVEMKQVVVRGVEAVERLRSYSRQSKESKTELVSLDVLVREASAIARPRMAATGHLLQVEEDLHEPPPVLAVAGELVSALVNLTVNAIDAAGEVGHVIAFRTGESEGGSFVEIEDDGPGMPPEIERRVFEPFFTTKGSEGTGLGLAMVYATVQRYGGKITLDTVVGRGTRFRLWFPTDPPSTPLV